MGLFLEQMVFQFGQICFIYFFVGRAGLQVIVVAKAVFCHLNNLSYLNSKGQ